MFQKRFFILFVLILVLIFRAWQSWPLSKNNSLELESPGFFLQIRESLAAQSNKLLPQPQAALLNGIILGLKSDLPADFKQALTNTSTVHIVVASGQNLTLMSGFLFNFAPILGRKKTIFLSIFASIFYSLLTGLQIPIIRAAIMIIFASIGKLFDREVDGWFSLLFSALLMLIIEPNWLLSISFQLSFLATVGVVILAPELIKRATILPEIIKEDLMVSLSAQALTAPIIAANFHQFSISGLLVNGLILWTVSPIMISGTAALLCSWLIFPLAQLLSLIPNILMTYFIDIVNFFNQPWSSIWVGKMSILTWTGYYVLLLAIYFLIKQTKQLKKEISS